jgi:DNA polymerase III epsilon subunit-like protein
MKLIYIDVETTGIPCPQSGLIQLAGAIEIDDAKPVFFQYDIQPFPSDEIDEEALQVNGITREDIATFRNPKMARSAISKIFRTQSGTCRKFVTITARFPKREIAE